MYHLTAGRLEELKKDMKGNILQPIRSDANSSPDVIPRKPLILKLRDFLCVLPLKCLKKWQKPAKRLRIGNQHMWMTSEDDSEITEGKKGKLTGLTVYYHFPTIKGIMAEYTLAGGKIAQGQLFGKAEGEEKEVVFKSGGKPQTIVGKSTQEGITYMKITSNLNESLIVGDWKYAKQASQFKMVLKDTETLGALSVAGEFKSKSILCITFDVVSFS